jgi:ATP-dependent DNA helicase RecG
VRLDGRIWIRVGPRPATAADQEEQRLRERSLHGAKPFDQRPCLGTGPEDDILDTYRRVYLPRLVAREVLEANSRTEEDQMASLRLFDLRRGCPTNAAVLAFGWDPLEWMPGAYVQIVRFAGLEMADPVQDSKRITGNLVTQPQQIDLLLPLEIRTARRSAGGLRQQNFPDYPLEAIRELVMNAVMHRSYEGTSSPVFV